jgi:putative CocE/NonD family hydrolase
MSDMRMIISRSYPLLLLSACAIRVAVSAPATGPTGSLADLLPELSDCFTALNDKADFERQAIYVPAADGVKLAVDVFLPKTRPASGKISTLYTATRYWRAKKGAPAPSNVQREWLAQGFAVVNHDVRGTGASFGQWHIPYAPQEVKDIGYIASWIAKQPWSDGSVVMTGNSYTGTTSLVGPAFASGTIKAVAPKFSDWDLYTDLTFPGGIATEGLSIAWGQFVQHLDLNETAPGVMPVDGTDGEALVGAAVNEHRRSATGFDQSAYLVTAKDQQIPAYDGLSIDAGGVYHYKEQISRSGIPIFGWGSWLDSGIAQGLLNRFMTLSNPQLTLIGPWTHGARRDANVFDLSEKLDPPPAVQDHLIQCYLSRALTGGKAASVPNKTLVYFTMGENKWKLTHVWPLPHSHEVKYYFDRGHTLTSRAPSQPGVDPYRIDFDATTGPDNRWSTQAGNERIDYGDRSIADQRLLTYTSQPLRHDTEITGQPVITLRVASTATDGNFIAYLEDVAPDGKTTYVSEGELRALHRKLSSESPPYATSYPFRTFFTRDEQLLVPGRIATLTFQFQATSVVFGAGHRIRLAIAGADKGMFLRVPTEGPVTIHVQRGGVEPSFISLPIVDR